VTAVGHDDGRPVVHARSAAGGTLRLAPRFVVDASGQAAVIGKARALRRFDDFFKNLAIFGYFRGAERLPGELANHILSAAFADGWFWYIPLHDDTMSVGAVVDARRWRELADGDSEATYRGRVLKLPHQEYLLLKFLAERPGRVFGREQLLSRVWGYRYSGGTRTVDIHIRRLRSKLGSGGAMIETVRHAGYKMRTPDSLIVS